MVWTLQQEWGSDVEQTFINAHKVINISYGD